MNSNSSSLNLTQERLQRSCMLILPVVVAAACLWMAKPQELTTSTVRNPTTVVSQSRSIEQGNGSVKFAADAMLTSLPVSSPKLITRPIEDITPGMRVLASNPELRETLPDSDVTP